MRKITWCIISVAVLGIALVLWWQIDRHAKIDLHKRSVMPNAEIAQNGPNASTANITATSSLCELIGIVPSQVEHIINSAKWNETTVMTCWGQLGLTGILPRCERESACQMIKVAQAADLPAPRNGEELLKTIYAMTLTNEEDGCIFGILSSVTNEAFTDLLLWGVSNFHHASISALLSDKVKRHWLGSKRDASISSLRNIGTPAVMDRLNKLLRQLQNEGHGIYEPGQVINPAKYPVEAREWLLNYPEPLVRYGMVEEWLHSGRPETPELIDEFCKRLNAFPDDFYLWHGDPDIAASKRCIIKEIKHARAFYVRRYKRWMADGQKENFNSGYYYDEMWDAYKKERGLP